jgi:hypothetical protein
MNPISHQGQFNPFQTAREDLRRFELISGEDHEAILMAAALQENFPYDPFDIMTASIPERWLPALEAIWQRPPGLREQVVKEHLEGFGTHHYEALRIVCASFRSWRSFHPWDAPSRL